MPEKFDVEDKTLTPLLMAAVRMHAPYKDCGQGFSKIGRKFGRQICGPPFLLHYDQGYREIANYEACMPIRQGTSVDDIAVRTLPGGQCFSLLHLGPYEELPRSYEKICAHIEQQGCDVEPPTREVYIKGPGMIFRGNPKKYRTEIQMLVKRRSG